MIVIVCWVTGTFSGTRKVLHIYKIESSWQPQDASMALWRKVCASVENHALFKVYPFKLPDSDALGWEGLSISLPVSYLTTL